MIYSVETNALTNGEKEKKKEKKRKRKKKREKMLTYLRVTVIIILQENYLS